MHVLSRLWNDDCGVGVLTAEWLFLMSILVVGLVGGFVSMRQTLLNELQDTGETISSVGHGFRLSAQSHAAAAAAGSSASDSTRSLTNGSVSPSTAEINMVPTN